MAIAPPETLELIPQVNSGIFTNETLEVLFDPRTSQLEILDIGIEALEASKEFAAYMNDQHGMTPESLQGPVDEHGISPHVKLHDAVLAYGATQRIIEDQLADPEVDKYLDFFAREDFNATNDIHERAEMILQVRDECVRHAEQARKLLAEPGLADFAATKTSLSELVELPADLRLAELQRYKQQHDAEIAEAKRQAELAAAKQAEADRRAKEAAEAKVIANIQESAAMLEQGQPNPKPQPKQPVEKPQAVSKPDELQSRGIRVRTDNGDVIMTVRVPGAKKAAAEMADAVKDAGDGAKATAATLLVATTVAASSLGGQASTKPVQNNAANTAAQIMKAPTAKPRAAKAESQPSKHNTGGTQFGSAVPNSEAGRLALTKLLSKSAPVTRHTKKAVINEGSSYAMQKVSLVSAEANGVEPSLADKPHTQKTVHAIDQLALYVLRHRTHGERTTKDVKALADGLAMVMLAARHPALAAQQAPAYKLKAHQQELAKALKHTLLANALGYTAEQKTLIAHMLVATTYAYPTGHKEKHKIPHDLMAEASRIARHKGIAPVGGRHVAGGSHDVMVRAASTAEKSAHHALSPEAGKGMSDEARVKFREILKAAGEQFNVDPNLIASFYYVENARTGDSTNNADAASSTPVTGDGNWREPAAPYGKGAPYRSNAFHTAGPGQFIPSTWRGLGVDGNGDGKKDPNNLNDALKAVANYMAHLGATTGAFEQTIRAAIYDYNHSDTYVQSVMNVLHYLHKTTAEAAAHSQAQAAERQRAQAAAEAAKQAAANEAKAAAEQQALAAVGPAAAPPAVVEALSDNVKEELQKRAAAISEQAKTALEARVKAAYASNIQKIVETARQEFNTHGNKPIETEGPNSGPLVEKYTGGPDGPAYKWCAYFVSWVIRQTHPDYPNMGSVSEQANWFQQHGDYFTVASGRDPKAGDIIMYGNEHTGVVIRVDGDWVETIEGNTSGDGSYNADGGTVGHKGFNYKTSAQSGNIAFGRFKAPD